LRLTDDLRTLAGNADLPILIDQEGGRVCRLGPPLWPSFPAAARFGDLYRLAPISGMEAARVNAAAAGTVLRQAGINVACSPLLDLRHPDQSDVVGDRAFGADPLAVASLGRAVLDGLAEAGVTGIIKHMPGHGRARTDSHWALPVVEASEEELGEDLIPFQRLAGRARIGMTAHIVYRAWDGERPATLSPLVIDQVIRRRIGFDGLLISDDILMAALTGPVEQRALAPLAAGCDLVLHGSGDLAEAHRLFASLPAMTAAASERLSRAVPGPQAGEQPLEQLLAKRDALLGLCG